jgi:hypothetical protein
VAPSGGPEAAEGDALGDALGDTLGDALGDVLGDALGGHMSHFMRLDQPEYPARVTSAVHAVLAESESWVSRLLQLLRGALPALAPRKPYLQREK